MSLEITGLAFSIVNDSGYAKLQAKAFRDISIRSNDDQGAAKGVRLFLEFLEESAKEYNPSEEIRAKKSASKKTSAETPDLSIPIFEATSPGSDPDLNPRVLPE